MEGNDGNIYHTVANKNGVNTWKRGSAAAVAALAKKYIEVEGCNKRNPAPPCGTGMKEKMTKKGDMCCYKDKPLPPKMMKTKAKMMKTKAKMKEAKAKNPQRKPHFFNAYYDLGGIGTIKNFSFDSKARSSPADEQVTQYILATNKISGDILFIGTDYVSRPEYGVVVVNLEDESLFEGGEIFYEHSPAFENDEEIIKEILIYYPFTTAAAIKEWIQFFDSAF